MEKRVDNRLLKKIFDLFTDTAPSLNGGGIGGIKTAVKDYLQSAVFLKGNQNPIKLNSDIHLDLILKFGKRN